MRVLRKHSALLRIARRPRTCLLVIGVALCALGPFAGSTLADAPGAPAATAAPTISPTTGITPGTTLTVTNAPLIAAPVGPVAYTDVWSHCQAGICTEVQGSGLTYAATPADIGYAIEVTEKETDSNPLKPQAGGPATSAPTSAVTDPAPVPPTNTSPPTIGGSFVQGGTLYEGAAGWSGAMSITRQWYRCTSGGGGCNAVAGATGTTYSLGAADVGHSIEVAETATNSAGTTGPVFSAATPTIQAAPPNAPTNLAPPGITGTASVGQTLTETPGSWTGSPSISRQWYLCDSSGNNCSPVLGRTGTTFPLTADDAGLTVVVTETATNSGGSASADSQPKGPIADATGVVPTVGTTVSISTSPSTIVAGQAITLIANVTSSSATTPPNGTLTFTNGGAPISGCQNLPVQSTGQSATVTCVTTFATSTPSIDAEFAPAAGSGLTGSLSSAMSLSVSKALPRYALGAPARASLGFRTTYTAHLYPAADSTGAIIPTGSIEFLDGTKAIHGCASRPLVNGAATCRVTYTQLGKHHISALYGGNANFNGAALGPKLVTVRPAMPTGQVASYLSWSFGFGPTSTSVRSLVFSQLTGGMQISLTCTGRGCPMKRLTKSIKTTCVKHSGKRTCSAPRTANLTSAFKDHRLFAGATLQIRLSHPHWLGKYYSFMMRAGHKPRIVESCLAVNSSRPGVGCN